MVKVSTSQPWTVGLSPSGITTPVSSYDTSTGVFHEVNSTVVHLSHTLSSQSFFFFRIKLK
jgi:hypothetical protein